jgi:hypothetical protein
MVMVASSANGDPSDTARTELRALCQNYLFTNMRYPEAFCDLSTGRDAMNNSDRDGPDLFGAS